MINNLQIRPIQQKDNSKIAQIIRGALEDFNANKPGTVYFDLTTDKLFELFQTPNSAYFIALIDEEIVGGCGIFPTENLPQGYSELVKLYLHKKVRGKGIGKALMLKCFETAKSFGYQNLYIESMPELAIAVGMYEKMGFQKINQPLGNSGHFGCDIWMVKEL